LFDCAGLLAAPESILDELAQQAALEALHGSAAVIFCVDLAKADWEEDRAVRALVGPKTVFHVATKSDLLAPDILTDKIAALSRTFNAEFLPTSSETGAGLDKLRNRIRSALLDYQTPAADAISSGHAMALTVRHRQAVTSAIESVTAAAEEIEQGGADFADGSAQTPAQQFLGGVQLEAVRAADDLVDRFGLGQIDLSVEVGAGGELARSGRP